MDLLNYINNIPDGAYAALLAGTIVSFALEPVKRVLKLQSEKVITFLLAVFSFLPGVLEYLLSNISQNPTLLGQRTAVVAGIATFVYRFATKPVTNLLLDAKSYREKKDNPQAAEIATPAAQPIPAADF